MLSGTDAAREQAHKAQEQKAAELLKKSAETLRGSGVKAEILVCWRRPAEQIIKQAQGVGADLIVVRAKDRSDSPRFPCAASPRR